MSALPPAADPAATALLALLGALKARHYQFVTITPRSHARVVARPDRAQARSLEDVFGWSLPFDPGLLPDDIRECAYAAGVIEHGTALHRAQIRVSALRDALYLHSAYPTLAPDCVFFGPDSYRFADLIADELGRCPPPPGARVIDVGTGAGVGAIVAAAHCRQPELVFTDINPAALRLARVNAAAAGVTGSFVETPGLEGLDAPIDIVTINPPYISDDLGRTYRDGGDMHGAGLALALAGAAIRRLAPGGRLILYTGSAIVDGGDALHRALAQEAAAQGCTLRYREIDPDVFGEELDEPGYRDVDRIALVAAIVTRPG